MMKWIFLFLALLIPGLAFGQSYNAQSYTAGSFYKGCGSSASGVCSADLLNLPVQINGTITFCQDCQVNPTCASGGTGAIATMINGAWDCQFGTPPPGTGNFTNLTANNGNITNLTSNNADLTNLTAGPGNVSITGSGTAGTNTITGIANLNGQMWATNFPGADIGAQVNNAITALGPLGGIVNIPPGSYTFSTTIQCPLPAGKAPVVILQGSGEALGDQTGTVLNYTGTGDAVNDFNTNSSLNNDIGCKIRDLSLVGPGSTTTAVGFHFGGILYAETRDVLIQGFGNGIKIENGSGLWTERYQIEQTAFNYNGTGIYFHCDTGCNQSFGHAHISGDFNITDGQYGLRVDGGGWIYATNIMVDGNSNPTTANATTMATTGVTGSNPDMIAGGTIESHMECNASGTGSCVRFNIAAGTSMGGFLVDYSGGTWSDMGTGAEAFRQTAAYINITVPNGGSTPIQSDPGLSGINPWCGGIFTVSTLNSGDTGAYLCGATFCGLILESWPGGVWVQSTPAPAAGKASIAWNSTAGANAIYNNTGATQSYTVTVSCSKHAG